MDVQKRHIINRNCLDIGVLGFDIRAWLCLPSYCKDWYRAGLLLDIPNVLPMILPHGANETPANPFTPGGGSEYNEKTLQ
ncbi:hypothetical protein J6590_032301 [Homalodisca vitripennis]|nr:hypothetical protein J6590_032301 [Homalodisca vitripennis]